MKMKFVIPALAVLAMLMLVGIGIETVEDVCAHKNIMADAKVHFSFDRVSGTTVTNDGNSGYDGTFHDGGPGGFVSSAGNHDGLYCAGSGSHVNAGDNSGVRPSDEFTLSTLVKFDYDDVSGNDNIVSKMHTQYPFPGDTEYYSYGLKVTNDGRIVFIIHDNANDGHYQIISSQSQGDNDWHMITGVWEGYGGKLRLYIDGIEDTSCTGDTGNLNADIGYTSAPLMIGKWTSSYLYFDGYIDEVYLIHDDLSGQEIEDLFWYSLSGVYISMDQYWSPYYIDEGGHNNNAGTTATKWASGKYGYAASFDGINDWVEVTDHKSASMLEPDGPMTVCAWINLDNNAPDAHDNIVSKACKDGSQYYSYGLKLSSDRKVGFILGGESHSANVIVWSSQYAIPTTGWVFVAGVYDGVYIRVYWGTTSSISSSASVLFGIYEPIDYDSDEHLQIGRYYSSSPAWSGCYFKGRIDEVAVFDRDFTSSQIHELAQHDSLGSIPDRCDSQP